MKKAINLLQKVNENNFLDLFFVISKPSDDVYAIESIGFLDYEHAQEQCDYMNKKYNTSIYRVFKTCTYIY